MEASHHRKIELQSPEDLRYLASNVSRRARQKIDLNLPPCAAPEGEDALRKRVEELVHEVKYEPYDRRLHARLQALQASLEAQTLALSQLRRSAPAAAAAAYVQGEVEQAAAAAAAVARLGAAAAVVVVEEPRVVGVLNVPPLERQADVEGAYGTAVAELGGLKSGLPATAARLERARKAAEYVEGSR